MSDLSPDPPADQTLIDEQLNAYFDGELNAEEMQWVEQRLAADEKYRRRLQQLQRTWDMLDALPRKQSPPLFTQSTLEIVAQSAAHELRRRRQKRWSWPLRIALFMGPPLIAALVSFQITRQLQQLPNRRLINELPIIENVFVYDRADSIEFLKMLEKDGVFAESDE